MTRINIAILASALLIASLPAHADHRADRGYDAYRHVHYGPRHHMPRWLERHDHFRAWYRYTPLRYNRRLEWDELYSIFLWERRYVPHRHFHAYRYHEHGFDYYRKYWKKGGKHRQHQKRRHYGRHESDRWRERDRRGRHDHRRHD